jgi:apolipoprotein N-acyltransferase
LLARLTGWRADLAALGLGMLSAAALPPVYALPVLLVAVPGLLALIEAARGAGGAFRRAWVFSFGNHLLGLYWITEAILFEAARLWWAVPLAVPALAALLALFVAAPVCLCKFARAGWPRVLALAGAWVLGDVARQFVATGFPWNPWGSVWEFPGPAGDAFIQVAAFVGVHGMTWATLVLAALPTLGRRFWAAGAAAVALWAGLGLWRLQTPAPPAPGVTIVLVQGDVEQSLKWDRTLAVEHFRRYLDLTRKAVADAGGGDAVVVWPESATGPFLLADDPGARAAIAQAAGGHVALAGSARFDAQGRPRNSLMEVLPDGSIADEYDKWHLVPFGEFQPSWFLLPMQVVPGGGFAAGDGPKTLAIPGAPPAGALICYEAIYTAEMVDEAHRPAWLVNVTNDAWFGNSSGPRQHLAGVRLRAVEEGLPLMRAANTGITAGFDAFGRELGRLPMNEQGTLSLALPGFLPATIYSRLGLAIPLVLAVASLVAGVGGRRFRARTRSRFVEKSRAL